MRALRIRRDTIRWQTTLQSVTDAARGGANLIPPILEAVESFATVAKLLERYARFLANIRRLLSSERRRRFRLPRKREWASN